MRLLRVLLVGLALVAAIAPLPSRLVEAWYSRRLYPAIQRAVTPLSNMVPIALLDVAALMLLAICVIVVWRRVRAGGFLRAFLASALSLLTLSAVVFLLFLALWGLNYRRVPLDEKLAYDERRVTREGAIRLGNHAVQEVNALYAAASEPDMPGPSLEAAFALAERLLGSDRLAVPGVPKRSLLERYFRAAAIDGMTDPFFLEVIINPDTLPFERPFVLMHEWAHLAGYANEAEANFVAWLSCTQGDAIARYSGWLAIYEHVAASLPRADRTALAAQLAAGPRRDLVDAAARYATATPVVRTAARDVYDTYLRANRVNEGVANYAVVVRLMLGAGMEDGGSPRLR
jgi:Protein of unknown function (DUF3810)